MRDYSANILITGLPGIGKTTVIRKLCERLEGHSPIGFYTQEIREAGVRKGFELVALDGRRGLLAHTDIKSPYRVSKYGVDVAGLDAFLDALDLLHTGRHPVVIDEIGKMECYSDKFRWLVRELLDTDCILIATIAARGGGLIADVKKRRDVEMLEATSRSRDRLPAEILTMIRLETF